MEQVGPHADLPVGEHHLQLLGRELPRGPDRGAQDRIVLGRQPRGAPRHRVPGAPSQLFSELLLVEADDHLAIDDDDGDRLDAVLLQELGCAFLREGVVVLELNTASR